jgi:DNA-binding XRE family transcriptional regulator
MAGHRPWSELRDKMSPEQRAASDALYQEKRIGLLVAEMRKQSGLTQTELAERIGTGQSTLSEMEAAGDMRITTLNKIVGELGGSVVIHMPSGDINLTPLPSE